MTVHINQIEIADDRNKYTVMLAVPKYSNLEGKTQTKKVSFPGFQMNMFNIFVVCSIALLFSVSTIQAAAIDATTTPAETTTSGQKICHASTPCGWAVYVPFTRRVDYFMRNTCSCPPEKACVRMDDDLSVSAYVYRCENRRGDEGTTSEPI